MKRILIPTDFSKNAYNAIDYAFRLRANEQCLFYLLHTYTPITQFTPPLYEGSVAIDLDLGEIYYQNAKKNMANTMDWIKENHPNVYHCVEPHIAFNMLQNEIAQVVDTYNIELIVMGSKGATGIKKVFLGSNTLHTVKNSKCPVLVIPAECKYSTPKDILFPTDYKVDVDHPALRLLKDLCKRFQANIVIFNAHVGARLSMDQQQIERRLQEYFEDVSCVFFNAKDKNVLDAVQTFEHQFPEEILCMVHNKHSFFHNLLFKPVIYNLLHKNKQPFLILPSQKKMNS